MSIDTYQTVKARALLDRIGWPEWLGIYATSGNEHLAFRDEKPKPFFEAIDQQGEQRELPDHLALCLIRNHLREFIWGWIASAPGCPDDDEGLLLAAAEAEAEKAKGN